MRYRALLMLAVALVLGAVAAWLVSSLVSTQIEQQAAMKPLKVTPVVVATTDLPVGTDLEAPMLRQAEWPADAVPEGAYETVEAALEMQPAVVIQEMRRGEVVLPHKVSTGVPRRGLTAQIPDGMRAVSIPVTEVRGVAGFVLPGDHVDILHTTAVGRRDNKPVTRTLLEDVVILGVDQETDQRAEDPRVVNAVTLLVDLEQAKKATLAQQVGELTLVLRNEGDRGTDDTRTASLGDLWQWGPEDRTVATPTSRFRQVEVIRGLEVQKETVADDGSDGDTGRGSP